MRRTLSQAFAIKSRLNDAEGLEIQLTEKAKKVLFEVGSAHRCRIRNRF